MVSGPDPRQLEAKRSDAKVLVTLSLGVPQLTSVAPPSNSNADPTADDPFIGDSVEGAVAAVRRAVEQGLGDLRGIKSFGHKFDLPLLEGAGDSHRGLEIKSGTTHFFQCRKRTT